MSEWPLGAVDEHQYESDRWEDLITPLTGKLDKTAIDEALTSIDKAATALAPLERRAAREWVDGYRGPDPRFRLARHLCFYGTKPSRVVQILADPNVADVIALQVDDVKLGNVIVEALVASPIRHLDVVMLSTAGIAAETVEPLLALACFEGLRILDLGGNPRLGSAGLVAIARAPGLAQLEALTINAEAASPNAVATLAASPNIRSLRLLSVHRGERVPQAGFGRPLLECNALDSLETIDLRLMGLLDRDLETIAGSPRFARVRQLSLSRNDFTNAGLDALFASKHLAQLEVLTIVCDKVSLTPELAKQLVKAPFFKMLQTLSLYDDGGGDIVRKAKVASPRLQKFTGYPRSS